MFLINAAPTYTVPVALTVPGQAEPMSLDITFKHLGRKAYDAWLASAGSFKDHAQGDARFLAEVVANWAGTDEALTLDALDRLLDTHPNAGQEIFDAYAAARTEKRTGN